MNIGPGEILLLAIFALIFFGPKRLPEIGRQVGRAIAEVRRLGKEFESEVKEITEPFTREVRDVVDPIVGDARELERRAKQTIAMDPDHSVFLGPPSAPVEEAPSADEPPPANSN